MSSVGLDMSAVDSSSVTAPRASGAATP